MLVEECKFLESFKFCPKCGGSFLDNNARSKRCAKCDFVYYFNPSAAVAAIIRDTKGNILIGVRANNPAKGSYDLPGGFVDSFETAEQSVIREVKEECHLDVVSTRYLFSLPNIYNYSDFDVHTLDLFFECTVDDFTPLKAADDVAALHFIPLADIKIDDFGLISVREGLKRYLDSIHSEKSESKRPRLRNAGRGFRGK